MKLPFDHFDLIARWYDHAVAGEGASPALLALADVSGGQMVLDIGGGTGRVAKELRGRGAHVVVCDRSPKMAALARRDGHMVVLGSADRLPFAGAIADRVVVVDAFHHFVHPSAEAGQTRAAAEMVRVTRQDGKIVIEEPDVRLLSGKMIALVEKLLLMGSRLLPAGRLAELFAGAGASAVSITDADGSLRAVFVPMGRKVRDG